MDWQCQFGIDVEHTRSILFFLGNHKSCPLPFPPFPFLFLLIIFALQLILAYTHNSTAGHSFLSPNNFQREKMKGRNKDCQFACTFPCIFFHLNKATAAQQLPSAISMCNRSRKNQLGLPFLGFLFCGGYTAKEFN